MNDKCYADFHDGQNCVESCQWYSENCPMLTPACEKCGCIGNNSCGHKCLDVGNLCTLSELIICPCCVGDYSHDRI